MKTLRDFMSTALCRASAELDVSRFCTVELLGP